MENENLLIDDLKKELQIELAEKISLDEIRKKLSTHVNYLIQHHFEELTRLLYRIDVDEKKLRNLLQENSKEDAGDLIASLIIERQLQKIKTRSEYAQHKRMDTEEEEKW